jgi:hypothetical protein
MLILANVLVSIKLRKATIAAIRSNNHNYNYNYDACCLHYNNNPFWKMQVL